MDTVVSRMRHRLVNRWSEVAGALERISLGASVKPTDGWAVIQPCPAASEEVVKFEVKPVVFNVPERGNHSSTNLYVVALGWLELRRDEFANNSRLVTHAFGTRAAYFRNHTHELEHVYGAHYDVTLDELGHPVFHAQMASFVDLADQVKERYQIESPTCDRMSGVLRNVRLPTAQMDFFSLSLQVFADHLVVKQSSRDEKDAFNLLLRNGEFLRGAAARSASLSAEVVHACFRARHWYSVAV